MKKIRLVFFGTPSFAIEPLQKLFLSEIYEVALVVSQPDRRAGRKLRMLPSEVKAFALEKNIPVITPEKIGSRDFRQFIKKQNVDIGVVVAYGRIMGPKLLSVFPKGCFNLHGSLLPRWRGAAPIQRCVMAGDVIAGVCLQVMKQELDAGDVICERSIPITNQTDSNFLYKELSKMGSLFFDKELIEFLEGQRTAVSQNPNEVCYAEKIDKKECEINWEKSSHYISCLIRGLSVGPQAWSLFKGKKIRFYEVIYNESSLGKSSGEIIELTEKGELLIACGSGSLFVGEVQLEGKKRMTVKDFFNGYDISIGDKFGN